MRREQRQLRFKRRNQEAYALIPTDPQNHIDIIIGINGWHDESFVRDLQSGSLRSGIAREYPATVVQRLLEGANRETPATSTS